MDRHRTQDGAFVVQRAWSNLASALGRDPCVPSVVTRPYVALVPRDPAVQLARTGESRTVVLDAAADRPVGPWTVSVIELGGYHDHERYLEVSLDRSKVAAGETAKLTITARRRSPTGRSIVGIVSTHDGRSSLWPMVVTVP